MLESRHTRINTVEGYNDVLAIPKHCTLASIKCWSKMFTCATCEVGCPGLPVGTLKPVKQVYNLTKNHPYCRVQEWTGYTFCYLAKPVKCTGRSVAVYRCTIKIELWLLFNTCSRPLCPLTIQVSLPSSVLCLVKVFICFFWFISFCCYRRLLLLVS